MQFLMCIEKSLSELWCSVDNQTKCFNFEAFPIMNLGIGVAQLFYIFKFLETKNQK